MIFHNQKQPLQKINSIQLEFYLLTAGKGGMNGGFSTGIMNSEYAPIINTGFGLNSTLNLTSKNGIKKTLDYVGKGDWERALYSGIGDAFDLTLAYPFLRVPNNIYRNIQFARSDAPMQLMIDL